jgi:uncharacterized protein YdeI (YjbR/CyaY-like superfamily)
MIVMEKAKKDKFPVIPFKGSKEFNSWLKKNHSKSNGIWLQFYKKASGVKTIVYSEALDESLCYGWIDSQMKKYDDKSYIQKFTPRRARSIWSKRNIEHIARLLKEKRVMEPGLLEIEKAKSDGRWENAYDSPSKTSIPADFLKELSKSEKAKAFFDSLNKSNVYAVAWRLQTAKKPETRAKRMKLILSMMAKGEKLHG